MPAQEFVSFTWEFGGRVGCSEIADGLIRSFCGGGSTGGRDPRLLAGFVRSPPLGFTP